jgi:hypothetical protein
LPPLTPYDRRDGARAVADVSLPDVPAGAPADAPDSLALPAPCRNCGTPRVGAYCSACGQHFLEDRLTFRVLAHEAWERVVERGLLHTMRDMMTQPGHVVRRYVGGQRRRYASPLSYLLVGGALSLLVFNVMRDMLAGFLRARMEASFGQSSPPFFGPEQREAYVRLTMEASQHTTFAALVICLVFALLLRLLFRRQRINLVEAAVFALYTFGHVYYLGIPLALLVAAGVVGPSVYVYGAIPLYGAVCALAAAQYFERPVRSAVKATVALVVAYGVFSFGMTTAIMAYVLWPRG